MMRAAFGTVDITPAPGIPMGGNVRADRAARGIHDALLASVMIVECGALTVVISCDLLSISTELSTPVKSAVAAALGITTEAVLVCATHTHSGPQVARDTPTAVPDPGAGWEKWLRSTPERILACVMEAHSRLQPARMQWGRDTVHGLAFNRRLHLRSGETCMNFDRPDPEDVLEPWGPVDEELTAILIVDGDGAALGALVHFTLHPAILVGERWLFSRDFVGPLVRTVQESIGDVPVLFLNGAEGNVNHLDYRRGRHGDPFLEIERVGSRLGTAAIGALDSAESIEEPQVTVSAAPISLRQRPILDAMLESARSVLDRAGGVIPSLTDGVPPEAYAAWLLRRVETYTETLDLRPIVIGIGPVVFACAPGEPFVEFALASRRRHRNLHVRVVALSDASIGYVPTTAAFAQGGYEVSFGTSTVAAGEGERLFTAIDNTISAISAISA